MNIQRYGEKPEGVPNTFDALGTVGAEHCSGPVDKGRAVVLDGGTLLMTYNVKQNPVAAQHCCALMRLSIWRAAEGNVEVIF
jgi:hypothetical protein